MIFTTGHAWCIDPLVSNAVALGVGDETLQDCEERIHALAWHVALTATSGTRMGRRRGG